MMTGLEVIKRLKNNEFEIVRQRGSHVFLRHKKDISRTTTVPVHRGKDVDRSLLSKILNDAQLSVEEFIGGNK